MTALPFAPKCLCLDIETAIGDVFSIYKIAGWRADTGLAVSFVGPKLPSSINKLDTIADGAA